ncbi:MAG TPA: hypothetical protein VLH77_03890 [Gammaproteobacteria bacterium]|nr:hypothetical protein [Gammaproteobacteria bacterium]
MPSFTPLISPLFDDIWLYIAAFNDLAEQLALLRINRSFFHLLSDNYLWEQQIIKYFPDDYERIKENRKAKGSSQQPIIWLYEYKRAQWRNYGKCDDLENGYFINRFNRSVRPQALFQLFKQGDLKAIKKLPITLLYYLTLVDQKGYSLVYWAHQKKHKAILKHCAELAAEEIRIAGEHNKNKLHWAVIVFQDQEILRKLHLENPSYLFQPDQKDYTPIDYAFALHNTAAINYFLEQNIEQDEDNYDNALYFGHVESAKLLIPPGQNIHHELHEQKAALLRELVALIDCFPYSKLRDKIEAILDPFQAKQCRTKSMVSRELHFLREYKDLFSEAPPIWEENFIKKLIKNNNSDYLAFGLLFLVGGIYVYLHQSLHLPIYFLGMWLLFLATIFILQFYLRAVRPMLPPLCVCSDLASIQTISPFFPLSKFPEVDYQFALNNLRAYYSKHGLAEKNADFLAKGSVIADCIAATVNPYQVLEKPLPFYTAILNKTLALAENPDCPKLQSDFKKIAALVEGAPSWSGMLKGLLLALCGLGLSATTVVAFISSYQTSDFLPSLQYPTVETFRASPSLVSMANAGGIACLLGSLGFFKQGRRKMLSQKIVDYADSAKKQSNKLVT